jgi:hypothetical protein
VRFNPPSVGLFELQKLQNSPISTAKIPAITIHGNHFDNDFINNSLLFYGARKLTLPPFTQRNGDMKASFVYSPAATGSGEVPGLGRKTESIKCKSKFCGSQFLSLI